jgi:hypothetical protein
VTGSPLLLGIDGLPIGCRLAGALIRRCDVTLEASVEAAEAGGQLARGQLARGHVAQLGRGSIVLPEPGRHRAVVNVQVTRDGIAQVRRRGRRGQRVRVRVRARSFDGRSATTTATGRLVLPSRYVVPAGRGFGVGVVRLTPGRRAQLAAIARQLAGVPAARCEGHADGSARRRHAHRLALRRASQVCAYLRSRGVTAALGVRSYGRSRPRASNATPRGRALNRRVEVVVVR